tara:strand:- start:3075 stop:3578 length:504 start_codon:yes stop_codon:yes gene_type:complete
MGNPMYGQNKFDNAVDNATGEIKHVKPSADGTGVAGAETVILTSADAGNRYFVNVSANTASFRLPSAYSNKGMEVHFHADIASDAENAKAIIVFTDSTAEFVIGTCLDAGAVHDTSVADDQIKLDGSGGALAGGDRVSLVCDGIHWYITEAVSLTAATWVSGTISRS